MTVNIGAIRRAIAQTLHDAMPELNASHAYTRNIYPPHAVVRLTEVDYRQTFGNSVTSYPMAIVVFAGGPDDEGAQDFLDELAMPFGPRSIRRIIEDGEGDDRANTLGGLVDYVAVDRVGDLEVRLPDPADSNIQYLAREWELRVDASN